MMNMLLRPLLWLVLIIAVAACQLPPGRVQRETAILAVSGPNVLVNGHKATQTMRFRSGDRVTTGPSSSALVRFPDGTSIQLAAKTDPWFEWVRDTVTVTVDTGWLWIKTGSDFSVDVTSRLAEIVWQSEGVVQAGPTLFRAYLYNGVLMPIRPPARQLQAMEVLEVVPGAPPQIGTLDSTTIARLRSMFSRYEFDLQMPNLERMDHSLDRDRPGQRGSGPGGGSHPGDGSGGGTGDGTGGGTGDGTGGGGIE